MRTIRKESASRPGYWHLVSVDGRFCSCEAASFGSADCSHRRERRAEIEQARWEADTLDACFYGLERMAS